MKDVKPILETIKAFDIHSLLWLYQEIACEKRKRTARDAIDERSMNAYSKWITSMRSGGGWSRDVSRSVSRVESREASAEKEDEKEDEKEEEDLDFAEYEREGYEDEEMEEV